MCYLLAVTLGLLIHGFNMLFLIADFEKAFQDIIVCVVKLKMIFYLCVEWSCLI